MASVKVVQKEGEEEVAAEVIAGAIVAISDGIKKLLNGPLNEDALHLLIAKAAPTYGPRFRKEHVTKPQVKAVLRGIADLEKAWLKPGRAR
jgi:hypothetical protein